MRSETYDRVWRALVAAVPDIYRDVAKGKDTPSLIADEVTERVVQAICGDRFADPWAGRTVLPLGSDLQDSDGPAYFQATPDEEPAPCRVRVDPDVWKDMGRPDTITVTIEPGDLLNDAPKAESCRPT